MRDFGDRFEFARRQQRLGVAIAAAAVDFDRAGRVAAQQRRKMVAIGALGEARVFGIAERLDDALDTIGVGAGGENVEIEHGAPARRAEPQRARALDQQRFDACAVAGGDDLFEPLGQRRPPQFVLREFVGDRPRDRAAAAGQGDGGDVREALSIAQRNRQRRLEAERISESEQGIGGDSLDRLAQCRGVGARQGQTRGERSDRLGVERAARRRRGDQLNVAQFDRLRRPRRPSAPA